MVKFLSLSALTGLLLVGLSNPRPVLGQTTDASDSRPSRFIYQVQHGDAAALAKALAGHFGDDVLIVAEPSSNSLLIRTHSTAAQKEVRTLLQQVDRAPETIGMDILFVEATPDLRKQPLPPPLPALTPAASPEQVQDYLDDLRKKGYQLTLQRHQLIALENCQAKSMLAADEPAVTGVVPMVGGDGAPQATKTIEYRRVGTVVEVAPRLSSKGRILLDLEFSDSKNTVPIDAIELGTDENNDPIRVSESPLINFRSHLNLPAGQAVLVQGLHKRVPLRQTHQLLIITAQVISTEK